MWVTLGIETVTASIMCEGCGTTGTLCDLYRYDGGRRLGWGVRLWCEDVLLRGQNALLWCKDLFLWCEDVLLLWCEDAFIAVRGPTAAS